MSGSRRYGIVSPGRCRRALVPFLAAALFVTGCARQETERTAGGPDAGPFQEIASPAGLGSGEPHLGVGPGGGMAMSWIEPRSAGGHRLLWSEFTGSTWSAPVAIAEGDSFFVNWADFPSFLTSAEAIYAHWLWKNGRGTYAYEIRLAVSRDGGATWSPPIVVHDDDTATEHGFVDMVAENGSARLLWLDGRAGEGLAEEDPRRSMHLRTALVGPDLSVREAALVDDRVCDCCATAMAAIPGGALAAYRDRSAEEVRDISLARWDGHAWSAPVTAHADGWRIAGCPVNGPALDAQGPAVALAWYTAAGDAPSVLCALSTDGGDQFGAPVRVDDGEPLGRVDALSLGAGSALVSWLEADTAGARVLVRVLRADARGDAVTVTRTSPARKSGFPRLARIDDQVFVAWTDVADSSRVRVARADLRAVTQAAP